VKFGIVCQLGGTWISLSLVAPGPASASPLAMMLPDGSTAWAGAVKRASGSTAALAARARRVTPDTLAQVA
jgi:hypothetical protein